MTGRQRRWRRRSFQGALALTLLGRALFLDTPLPTTAAPGDLFGITERISLDEVDDGVFRQANNDSLEPSVSADGRFVAFTSEASLVSVDKNGDDDVYLRDRLTGEIRLVSVSCFDDSITLALVCGAGNDDSFNPQISADGLKVTFQSWADNLEGVPTGNPIDDDTDETDIYLADFTPPPEVTTSALAEVPVITLVSVRAVERCPSPPTTPGPILLADDVGAAQLSCPVEPDSSSTSESISADGRFVAFQSAASNLGSTTSGISQIYVHDRQLGTFAVVSVSSDGTNGNSGSVDPVISADGRYVAFKSFANNLVPGDTNGDLNVLNGGDVFLHDRQTATTTRVSVATGGIQGDGSSGGPGNAISDDGSLVVFWSAATNLVAGDTNGIEDVFVHDHLTATTTRVSVATGGVQATGSLENLERGSDISGDGRYVVFLSMSTNLVAGDTNGWADVFMHDRQTGTTTRVSLSSGGAQGNQHSFDPAISADGRYVTFMSSASNLVANDANPCNPPNIECSVPSWIDVFVRDTQTNTTTLVSKATDGTQQNAVQGLCDRALAISADGRFVAFCSTSTNLVAGDTNNTGDIFVHDRTTSETTRVSVATNGTQTDDFSFEPVLSADGRYVGFWSWSNILVEGDSGDRDPDVFVRDRQTNETTRISVTSTQSGVVDEQFNGPAEDPTISADGTQITFEVPFDDCGGVDVAAIGSPCVNHFTGVWIRDLNQNRSVHIGDVFGAGEFISGFGADISSDGRFVALEIDFHSTGGGVVAGVAPSGDVGAEHAFQFLFLYDRDTDRDGVFDEPDPEPPAGEVAGCINVCLELGGRHPDEADSRDFEAVVETVATEAEVEVDDKSTEDPSDDEIVVAYSFTDFDSPTPGSVGTAEVPLFQQIVVVSTFDPDILDDPPECTIGTNEPVCTRPDTHISTGVASVVPTATCVAAMANGTPPDTECYGDGFGSGQPALSADGRYLAFVVTDGELITLEEGQTLPAIPQGGCFVFGDSVPAATGDDVGAAEIRIPCQVVLNDLEHPERGLRAVSVGGDPRDPGNPEVSVAVEPTQLGATVGFDDCCSRGSSAPSLSADGRVIGFQTEADNLLGLEPGYEYPDDQVPYDSNEESDVYVRELAGVLGAAPNPLGFGAELVGTSSTQTLTLTNRGYGPVSIPTDTTFAITDAAPADVSIAASEVIGSNNFTLSVDGCAGTTIHGGESCDVQIAFTPTSAGLKTAFFTMTYPGARFTTQQIIAEVSGIGVLRPRPRPNRITVNPTNLDFGTAILSTQSGSGTATVTNDGGLPVAISSVTLAGANPEDFVLVGTDCVGTLPAAGVGVDNTCTIEVAAKTTVPGPRTAVVRIADSAFGNPHLIGVVVSSNEPSLILNPGVVKPGTTTTAIGQGWPPGATVDLTFAGDNDSLRIEPETVVVAPDGTFEATILVLPKREAIPRVVSASTGTITVDENLLVTLGSLTLQIDRDSVHRG